jgi:hypothetical protein
LQSNSDQRAEAGFKKELRARYGARAMVEYEAEARATLVVTDITKKPALLREFNVGTMRANQ